MADDMPERLRNYRSFSEEYGDYTEHHPICDEAADRIEALEKQVAELLEWQSCQPPHL